MVRVVFSLIAVTVVFCGLACDPAPTEGPVAGDEASEPQPLDNPPATRPIDFTRTRTLSLEVVPLELTVPESWSVEERGGARLLTGPIPSGEVRIQVAQRPEMTREQLGYLQTGMEAERKQNPDIRLLELRDGAGMKVLERQSASDPVQDDPSARVYRWTLTYFVPSAKGYNSYELNFLGLTEQEFKADGPFLKQIVESVRLRERGGASTNPSDPA